MLFHKVHFLLSLKCPSVSFSKSDYRCNSFESALTVGAGWYFFFNLTKFHTHTKQQKTLFLYTLIFIFWIENWKTKDSAPSDSMYSVTSICTYFLTEYNFDSLRLFQNILNVPPFQRNYYQSLYCDFVLHVDLET